MLYRYMLSDLLRVFGLTATVLVTIIAFGATIKPLASDTLLSAAEIAKYLMLAIIPMLQFALPFSAGFAATMVFHRMTGDNEIQAAAASGISYRRLLVPIVGFGLVLTLVMVLLTQWVIPRFWGLMERTIAADITRMFQASIDSGLPFEFGNVQIYADDMRVVVNPSDTQAEKRLVLLQVAAAELGPGGRIEMDVTANQAVVDIYRERGETYLKLIMNDTVVFDQSAGHLAHAREFEPPNAIVVPSLLRDELRSKTRGQLLALRENPDAYGPVAEAKAEVAERLWTLQLWASIQRSLDQHGAIELVQSAPGRRRYVIRADRIESGVFRAVQGDAVQVTQFEGSTAVRRMQSAEVVLSRAPGATLRHPAFELELLRSEVTDLVSGGLVNQRERLMDRNLILSGLGVGDLLELPSHELLDEAHTAEKRGAAVSSVISHLQRRLVDLQNEIRSRLHMRYAQSTTAVLLLVLGATLAMWLRGSVPLVIYIWAFAPSVLDLIVISGGDKMMRDGAIASGFLVMWSGNLALLLMFGFVFTRLMRN